ncbi:MAG: type II toxin-antitoxin system VapB family antitoxin [Thiotrichales bacterium]|nr:type II toxin-antitoxin system VapB family antitoxin [Thiotrichales bacterium]
MIEQDSCCRYLCIMKTTVDIPDRELEDAMRFTNAKTKREAIVSAIEDFNRRMRLAALVRYAGSCPDLIAPDELQAARRRG